MSDAHSTNPPQAKVPRLVRTYGKGDEPLAPAGVELMVWRVTGARATEWLDSLVGTPDFWGYVAPEPEWCLAFFTNGVLPMNPLDVDVWPMVDEGQPS